ncbi:unnamed protein product, partial [Soboliphyme baturini]|uniref:DNA repair protein RecO n=1 Tax=Soboliphyme baturini TaxID=241478 RepID=A0A183IJ89_9BILA
STFKILSYFFRVELLKGKKHISARIRHFQQGIILEVSTKEAAIANKLYR